MLFFNYSKKAPYMHYGVVGPDRKLKHFTPIPLPGPRLPHDMCYTKNYSILNDFPLFWDPKLLEQGIHANKFHQKIKSRFAVIPRYGSADQIRWFEASPTFVLHWTNAYEEGDEIVLDGFHQMNPSPSSRQPHCPEVPKGYERMMVYLSTSAMQSRLYRWRFNLTTGATTEQVLDPTVGLEFGVINNKFAGRRNRYVYSTVGKPGWFLFTALVKHDLDAQTSVHVSFGPDRYGSEPGFAPRPGGSSEDDGYLVTLVTDMAADRSEVVVYDAKNPAPGPVCRLLLPQRISSGTHATWACADRLVPSSRL